MIIQMAVHADAHQPRSQKPLPRELTPRRGLRRFSPSAAQVVALDGVAAMLAYTLAMVLRFVDEGAVPPSYAARLAPWVVAAAVIHLASGELMTRLRKPRSPLGHHPVLPFVVGGLAALATVLGLNYSLVPVGLRLPLSVAVIGPLLASAASAALRVAAAAKPAVTAEDLLPRGIVALDVDACASALRGRRVLITGAAGSIGSELARQVLRVSPASLLLLDSNESGLFDLQGELEQPARIAGVPLQALMGNVADPARVQALFQQELPQVVFHAAAYKHVPLVEANPEQGFVVNVLGTLSVCRAAAAAGTERLVVISTDKAVRPSSFMGLTKRLAELILLAVGQEPGVRTQFSAVRFGNVLGSRGSVVPTMLRQIEIGGPLTITHPDAQRYFMTISEAASLVLRSAAFGGMGGVFVLDMGDELRIVDLAEKLVRLKGLKPGRDVPFEFIGLRPGEKLREELVGDHETMLPTDHPYVRRIQADYAVDGTLLLEGVAELERRRQAGALEAADYPDALREVIDRAVRPAAVAA